MTFRSKENNRTYYSGRGILANIFLTFLKEMM
jgi:hypothetical protein